VNWGIFLAGWRLILYFRCVLQLSDAGSIAMQGNKEEQK